MVNRLKSSYQNAVKPFSSNARRIIKFAWSVSPSIYSIKIIMMLVQGLLPIGTAYLGGRVINLIVHYLSGSHAQVRQIFILTAILAGLQFIQSRITAASFYLNRHFDYRFELYLTSRLFDQFIDLDHSYYEDAAFNNRLNKLEQNRFALRNFSDDLLNLLSAVITLLATGLALVFLNPLVTVIIIVSLLPSLWIEVRSNVARYRHWDTAGNDWRILSFTRGILMDTKAIKEVKLFKLAHYLQAIWQDHFAKARLGALEIEKRAQVSRAGADAVESATELGVQFWLLLKVLATGSRFGLGDFQFYRQILSNFTGNSSGLIRYSHALQEESLYVKDFFDLLDLKPNIVEPHHPIIIPPDRVPSIEFRDVSFSYPGSTRPVLKNFSFVIQPGEDVALVGENGVGKSTIIKLLMRFYDPTSGQILINGQDLRQISLDSWYHHVGVLFQDFNYYWPYSVRTNIGVGRYEMVDRPGLVESAAAAAGAADFINLYPLKYDQRLNKSFDDGVEPSGGQWQRIALARAFFRNSSVLILDEPTSAIDAKGEYEIFEQIKHTQKAKTTIIISHRFSTVRNANKIFVVDGGRIVENGSHQELMRIKSGKYRHMFELQAQGYK